MHNELKALIEILRENKFTIAFAESITSGLLANEFGKQFNIGEVFLGSLVTYQEECKIKVLNVKKSTIDTCTAESREVTDEMVLGLKKILDADLCIAVTGLATEGGSESKEKPVGTAFVSILFEDKIYPYRQRFYGDREQIIFQTCYFIFSKALDVVTKNQDHGIN